MKLVYLDSSDFSNLSKPPDELSLESQKILAMLRAHKRAGSAAFFMSAVHISEAIHAADQHKEAALRRAELMRELCGSNILRLPGDLPKLEIQKALKGEKYFRLSTHEIMSGPGEWFGACLPLDGMPDRRAELHREILANLDRYPRQQRRKLRSQLCLDKKSSRERWRALLSSGAQSVIIPYPYNLLSKETIIAWFLKEISDVEFRNEVLKITHDPYIMFKYLIDTPEHRQGIYDSLRKNEYASPDQTEIKLIEALSVCAKSDFIPDLPVQLRNFYFQPSTLRKVISLFEISVDEISDAELPKMVVRCPSLSTFVGVSRAILETRAYSYLTRTRLGNMSVKPRDPSDFGDLMHCHYAPYFDVFRCDARFGAHLKKHAPIRARIADRISDVERMLSVTSGEAKEVA